MFDGCFIGLHILDGWLTSKTLLMGAAEFNPIMVQIGDSMLLKGLLAMAIVMGLRFFGKEKLILPLCIGMFGVVTWNLAMCLLLNPPICY